jgi:hypothetical protein
MPLYSTPTQWFNVVGNLNRPFLWFLNVRFAVVPESFDPPRGWRLAAQAPGSRLLENTRALPRAFIPRRVVCGGARADVVDELGEEHDFRRLARISSSEACPHAGRAEHANTKGTVSIRRQGQRYLLETALEESGWVVVSETAWRGWHAVTPDGELPIARANLAFLGIHVPAGETIIRLVFRPRSFVVGCAVSGATLTLLLLVLVGRATGRRAAPAP